MPIYSAYNQYRGVNAHLHSYFQAYGGWPGFHNRFLTYLMDALGGVLPDGYVVGMERGLQIKQTFGDQRERKPMIKPDVAIYATPKPERAPNQTTPAPTLTRPVSETMQLDDDDYYLSVVIYRHDSDEMPGTMVTRLELLSPSNKMGGSGAAQYIEKRNLTLQTGICMVEIDLLHETQSPIRGLPVYPHDEQSFAYHITVSDPYPTPQDGQTAVYGFAVDTWMPAAPIPLGHVSGHEAQVVTVDYNAIYNQAFHARIFSQVVDYMQEPQHLWRYSAADQQRIIRRMQAVQAAYERGDDLTQSPLPLT